MCLRVKWELIISTCKGTTINVLVLPPWGLMRLIFGVDKTPTMSFPQSCNLSAVKYPQPQLFLLAGSIIENVGTFTANLAESAAPYMFQKIKIWNVFNLRLSSEGRVVSWWPCLLGLSRLKVVKFRNSLVSNSKKFLSSQKKKTLKNFQDYRIAQGHFYSSKQECKCFYRDSLTIIVPFNIPWLLSLSK